MDLLPPNQSAESCLSLQPQQAYPLGKGTQKVPFLVSLPRQTHGPRGLRPHDRYVANRVRTAPSPPNLPPPKQPLPLEAKAQITTWLEELLAEPDFAQAFLVDLKVGVTGRVEIFLDADAGVDLALCRRVSRALEEKMDESQILGEKYTLEISSPGPSRPMTLARQFPKHVGRTLDVQMEDELTVTGVLTEVDDDGFVLTEQVVRRDEHNKKIKAELRHEIPFGSFRGATVQFSFK